MPEDIEDKQKAEAEMEEKGKQKPFWETLPPIVLIGGVLLIILALRSMTLQPEQSNTQLIWIIGIVVALLLLARTMSPAERMVTPKEAELLTEREMERKLRWGQFPMMSNYMVGPVSDLMHRDARGLYYNVQVKITNPFRKTEYFIGKVMATGPERTFTTIIESIGPMLGRKIHQERDVTRVPDYVKRAEKYPMLEKIWGLGR